MFSRLLKQIDHDVSVGSLCTSHLRALQRQLCTVIMRPKVIEVKPVRGGWKVLEAPGVKPVFPGERSREHAIDYARTRQGFGQGEIRVLNSDGQLVEIIPFDNRGKSAVRKNVDARRKTPFY